MRTIPRTTGRRRTPGLVVGTIVCIAMTAACASPVERVDGDAAPAGTASAPPTSASPTASAAPNTSPTASAAPVLGPDGFGALKLGMTRKQAEATGLIGPFKNQTGLSRCTGRAQLRGAPTEGGYVLHYEQLGVVVIAGYAGVKTPEGIGIGSTRNDMLRAYPNWKQIEAGRGYTGVPGNDNAVYELPIVNGIVANLALAHKQHGCYN